MNAAAESSRAQRRVPLLSCAREVFTERGYHGASVDHVIRAAGAARGTFYNYFDSKRAVFQEYWARRVRGADMLPLDEFLVEVPGVLRDGFLK